MRLPTFGEAMELGKTHDLPNVDDESEVFWTDELIEGANGQLKAFFFSDAGNYAANPANSPSFSYETVCVTTPTN